MQLFLEGLKDLLETNRVMKTKNQSGIKLWDSLKLSQVVKNVWGSQSSAWDAICKRKEFGLPANLLIQVCALYDKAVDFFTYH